MWGLHSNENYIGKGYYLFEYVGQLIDRNHADKRENFYTKKDLPNYLFDIGAQKIEDQS